MTSNRKTHYAVFGAATTPLPHPVPPSGVHFWVVWLAVMLLMIWASLARCAEAPDPKNLPDVPEIATSEMTRIGNMARRVGDGIQAGPEAGQDDMASPPEDDSDRFFFTVAVTDDPKYARDCDRLLADIQGDKLKAWVLPNNAQASWAHLSVRIRKASKPGDKPSIDDSWFAKMAPLIEGKPFPAIVLQPPRNGSHGPHKTICGIHYGYGVDGNYETEPETTNRDLIAIYKSYSNSRYAQGLALLNNHEKTGGHAQPAAARRNPPPFDLDREPDDRTKPRKIWPEHIEPEKPKEPPRPAGLTLAEIRQSFPEIPARDALDYSKRGLTAEQIIAEEEALHSEVNKTPSHPTERTALYDVLGLITLAGLTIAAVYWLKGRRGTVPKSNETASSSSSSVKS